MAETRSNQQALEILVSGMKVARQIIEKRMELDRQGKTDEPLHVFLGENHRMPGHYLHNLVIAKELMDHNVAPLISFEDSYDNLENVMPRFSDLTSFEKTSLAESDSDGSLALHADIAFIVNDESPLTEHNLKRFIAQNQLPVTFSDASRSNGIINIQDYDTMQSIEALGYDLDLEIDSKSSEGVHVRNHHIIKNSVQAAERNGSRIILHKVGNKHVCDPQGRIHNEHTLPSVARESFDAEFLAFTREDSHTSGLRQSFNGQVGNHRITGLPARKACYDSWSNRSIPGQKEEITSLEDEEAFLSRFFEHPAWKEAGLELLVSADDLNGYRKQLQDNLKKSFSDYISDNTEAEITSSGAAPPASFFQSAPN